MTKISKEMRSYVMSQIKSRDTVMELATRPLLEALGFTYHPEDGPKIPGAPDFAHLSACVAIFLDGCFWHGCPRHFNLPDTNASDWYQKIRRNQERDAEVDTKLREMGWVVIRVWEHSLRAIVAEYKKAQKRKKTRENKTMG